MPQFVLGVKTERIRLLNLFVLSTQLIRQSLENTP